MNQTSTQTSHDAELDAVLLAEIAEAFNDILTEISGHAVLIEADASPAVAEDLAGINSAVSRAAAVSRRLAKIAGSEPLY